MTFYSRPLPIFSFDNASVGNGIAAVLFFFFLIALVSSSFQCQKKKKKNNTTFYLEWRQQSPSHLAPGMAHVGTKIWFQTAEVAKKGIYQLISYSWLIDITLKCCAYLPQLKICLSAFQHNGQQSYCPLSCLTALTLTYLKRITNFIMLDTKPFQMLPFLLLTLLAPTGKHQA